MFFAGYMASNMNEELLCNFEFMLLHMKYVC